ncbi:MAG: NTP transferase domain-containing protein, partial [Propionibacteriaceae bacterium]|nr:NTP transferase domain-containing protein [Propionibacteriaceae bacterium]
IMLAAGAGRRAGGPKALRTDIHGRSRLSRSACVLLTGGCASVIVVLGSEATRARALLPADLRLSVVEVPNWSKGMGVSLQAGLSSALSAASRATMISLVDLPDVSASVVARVLELAPGGNDVLARACYRGQPGHPVLIGREHIAPLLAELASLAGRDADTGARAYLARHNACLIECGDLASGKDSDFAG